MTNVHAQNESIEHSASSLIGAATVNMEAIARYDVLVHHSWKSGPPREWDESKNRSQSLGDSFERIIVDIPKEQCTYAMVTRITGRYLDSTNVMRSVVVYRNGKAEARGSSFESGKISFSEFRFRSKVPLIEATGFGIYPPVESPNRTGFESIRERGEAATVHPLANGNSITTLRLGSGDTSVESIFDRRSFMPLSLEILQKNKEGKSVATSSQEVHYRLKEGIATATSVTYFTQGEELHTEGSAEIEWLSLNDPERIDEFGDMAKLPADVAEFVHESFWSKK